MKQTALITGASSGIGETFARKLAEKGYDLILVARRKDKLDQIATELSKKYSVNAVVLVADLSQREDICKVADRIKNCENLTMLVNNAGFGTIGDFADVDFKDHQAMHNVHITASIQLSHAAIPDMIAHKGGNIVNVSSVSGFLFGPKFVNYFSTEAYLVTFSRSLHEEVKGHGLTVQALCPGFTHTEFHAQLGMENFDKKEIPNWMWMSSDKVVEISLNDLKKRKSVCIPGLRYKILVALLRTPIIGSLMHKIHRKK